MTFDRFLCACMKYLSSWYMVFLYNMVHMWFCVTVEVLHNQHCLLYNILHINKVSAFCPQNYMFVCLFVCWVDSRRPPDIMNANSPHSKKNSSPVIEISLCLFFH